MPSNAGSALFVWPLPGLLVRGRIVCASQYLAKAQLRGDEHVCNVPQKLHRLVVQVAPQLALREGDRCRRDVVAPGDPADAEVRSF